ncbi:MAG: hypothetical protein ACJ8AE_07885, partial [Gemmatimonadaceae bacterium]
MNAPHVLLLDLALLVAMVSAGAEAQIVAPRPTIDSAAALAALISDAARVNAQIPASLLAYRARIETEMS